MIPRHSSSFAAALAAFVPFAFAACGPPPPPGGPVVPGASASGDAPTAGPSSSASEDAPTVTSGPSASGSSSGAAPELVCKLPAPKKSGDACKTDADCAVSDPCHARACVAKTKGNPPRKDTICTMMMDCQSADRNPCTCFEGECALVPPKD